MLMQHIILKSQTNVTLSSPCFRTGYPGLILRETYYILAKERGLEIADYFLQNILGALPIKPLSNSFSEVIEAAKIKAQYPISYADALVVATALRERIPVLTGDPEFEKVKHLIEIEWLS